MATLDNEQPVVVCVFERTEKGGWYVNADDSVPWQGYWIRRRTDGSVWVTELNQKPSDAVWGEAHLSDQEARALWGLRGARYLVRRAAKPVRHRRQPAVSKWVIGSHKQLGKFFGISQKDAIAVRLVIQVERASADAVEGEDWCWHRTREFTLYSPTWLESIRDRIFFPVIVDNGEPADRGGYQRWLAERQAQGLPIEPGPQSEKQYVKYCAACGQKMTKPQHIPVYKFEPGDRCLSDKCQQMSLGRDDPHHCKTCGDTFTPGGEKGRPFSSYPKCRQSKVSGSCQ